MGRVARWGTHAGDGGYEDLSIEQSVDAAYDALIAFQHDLHSGFARLERSVWSVIESMATEGRSFLLLAGLERQDNRLWRHSINVSLYAARLARALGIEGTVLHDVTVGALLHDVGYLAMGVSPDLPSLTREQRRRHPERGAALLAGVDGMPGVPILVAYEHHRSWDGAGGYPDGTRPPNLASQITAIADTWDTLLQTRKPLPHGSRTQAAVRTLGRLRGELLQPDLVDLFLELLGLSSEPAE
ncbi:MAG: HD domain-containing protein [Thermoanaerobaculia bacterium]